MSETVKFEPIWVPRYRDIPIPPPPGRLFFVADEGRLYLGRSGGALESYGGSGFDQIKVGDIVLTIR